ncbi:MAG: hypothetical protein J6O00_11250 [Clostridiales bacterium]|nr:hypothetical protein [Clostridiales bacterium]
MQIPRFKRVDRKRLIHISYKDPEYVKYYDLDLDDFQELVMKLKNGERLTDAENDRYGIYIITVCIIVQEGPRFKNKPVWEREEMIEQQYMEMLSGITTFNPNNGKIYSYAYRIGYTAACHYYTGKIEEAKRQEAITEHCEEELLNYMEEFIDHKTRRH